MYFSIWYIIMFKLNFFFFFTEKIDVIYIFYFVYVLLNI